MFRRLILPWLVLWMYRAWSATWRTTIMESEGYRRLREEQRPRVFAHWHRDEFAMLRHAGAYKIAAMTSHSKDGQLIDFVVRKQGGMTAKGSSSRGGGAALHGLLKLVKSGYTGIFAVDGPRGPIFRSKPGVFKLSLLAGAAIIPLGVSSHRYFVFKKSWNQARLPLPFTRVVLVLGEPLAVELKDETDLQAPDLALRLDAVIADACRLAEQENARRSGGPGRKAEDTETGRV